MSTTAPHPLVALSDRRARFAISIIFAMGGVVWGNWIPRIPDVKASLELSNSTLGLALLGTAFGSVIAMQGTGMVMSKHGTRGLVRVLTPLLLISLLTIPLLDFNVWGLFLALLIVGMFHGAVDVAMNGHCIAVERRYQRPIVNSMHAAFSLGGVSGAVTGGLAASHHLNLWVHFGLVALVGCALVVSTSHLVLTKQVELSTVVSRDEHGMQAHAPLRAVLTTSAIVLSLLSLAAFVAEGGINDWVTVYMRDHAKSSAAAAATAYGVFQGMMAVVRLIADRYVHRWGPVAVLRVTTTVGAVGLGIGLLSGTTLLAIVGFAFAGIGVAVIIPLLFSAAGHAPSVDSARQLSTVTTAGYFGFFVGPPLLGFVADASLTAALFIPVLLIAFISTQARLFRHASGGATEDAVTQADTLV